MSTLAPPFNLFKLATIRATKKPLSAAGSARRVAYALNSAFHSELVAARGGADSRATMIASAAAFVSANPLFISNTAQLRLLFPGFEHMDDYLRKERHGAAKSDLKALAEGPLVLNQAASGYVAGGGVCRAQIARMGQRIRAHRAWCKPGATG